MIQLLTFSFLFFLHLSTGFSLLPLFLFWHALFSQWYDTLFWAGLVGISLRLSLGHGTFLIFSMGAFSLIIMILIRYVFVTRTPLILSLLLIILTFLLHIGPSLTFDLRQVIFLAFMYALVFFSFYVGYLVTKEEKSHIQKRLF